MIVIGDIHGEYDALMRLVDQLPEDEICFAGDMVDRGPKSCQVLDFVIENGHDAVKGNHEYMFHHSPNSRSLDSVWTAHGKKVCLDSFNGDEKKLKEYRQWAKNLPLYIEYPDCVDEDGNRLIVSHTGINYIYEHADPHAKDDSHFGYTMLWENDWTRMNDREGLYDFFNIIGHTPQKWAPTIRADYACIDGGSFINKPEFGRITAMQYPSMEIWEENV